MQSRLSAAQTSSQLRPGPDSSVSPIFHWPPAFLQSELLILIGDEEGKLLGTSKGELEGELEGDSDYSTFSPLPSPFSVSVELVEIHSCSW